MNFASVRKQSSKVYLVWNFVRSQVVQNFARGITNGTRKYDHLTPFLKKKELRWLPVASELFYRSVCRLNVCRAVPPITFSHNLLNVQKSVIVELAIHKNWAIPLFKTASGQRTFYYRTLSLRNFLDPSLKLCRNVKLFKQSTTSKLLQELYERPHFLGFEHVISTINNVVFRGRFLSFYC